MYTIDWSKAPLYYDFFNSTKSTQVGSLIGELGFVNSAEPNEQVKSMTIKYTMKGLSLLGKTVKLGSYTDNLTEDAIKEINKDKIYTVQTKLHLDVLTKYVEMMSEITLIVIENYEEDEETKQRDKEYTFTFPYRTIFNAL